MTTRPDLRLQGGAGESPSLAPPHLPAELNVAHARLPDAYSSAKQALANCASVDECKDWGDKAEALASYARMSNDDVLRKFADRIQARAVRRCGELLKGYQAPGTRTDKPSRGTPTRLTQHQAATTAGLSKDQEVTASRVAKVPEEEFEEVVESDDPPTVTKLAKLGTKSRPYTANITAQSDEDAKFLKRLRSTWIRASNEVRQQFWDEMSGWNSNQGS